jgi:hypothetical protein
MTFIFHIWMFSTMEFFPYIPSPLKVPGTGETGYSASSEGTATNF